MSLYAELRRRKVFKVGGAYLVVAWLLIQVAATVAPQLQLPDWAPRMITLVLLLGFPVALVLAWALDSTPEGIKVDGAPTGDKRIYAIAGVLAALVLVWYFRGPPPESVPGLADAAKPAPAAGAPAASTATDAAMPAQKSIAVLAFTDLSPAKDQEYFSDGIAEEILNALVKVKDLKVAGRTSSFYYKGKNEDLRRIGETLGVAHILEGSVRKQGEKVRITAQLIKADDGFHLWSETYDGDLADVFELQERIARNITDQLKLVLQGGQEQRLVPVATADPEAYAKFLQATAIFNRRERAKFPNAIALLEQAIELDPSFARAHARLGAFHVLAPEYTGADFKASLAAARLHANRAIELLPTLAEPHTVLAYAFGQQRDLLAERESYERALAIDPDDVLSNFWASIHFMRVGDMAASRRQLERVLAIDPMLPNGLTWRGWIYLFDGDTVNARRVLERALDLGIGNAHLPLSLVERAEGNDAKAIAEMELGLAAFGASLPVETPGIVAAGVFGDDAARRRAVAHVEGLIGSHAGIVSGPLAFSMIMLGEHARGLDVIQSGVTTSSIWQLALWGPSGRDARRLPQFAEFARRVGFVAVWDKYGPPDGCRKDTGGDYRCE